MIVTLERFSAANHQDNFALLSTPGWFEIQTVLLSALDPRDSRRFLHSCLVLFSDKSDLLLFATECRLQLHLSTFTVPTPPVQPFLPRALGQGGGVWDEVESSGSSSSPGQNAVEIQ